MTTRPVCAIFTHLPSSGANPNPSAPITAPEWTIARAPMTQLP